MSNLTVRYNILIVIKSSGNGENSPSLSYLFPSTVENEIIQLNQDLIHTELKDLVKTSVEETLNAMLDAEADKLVNADRYAREEDRKGYRAGHYDRNFTTTAGDVNLKMPGFQHL